MNQKKYEFFYDQIDEFKKGIRTGMDCSGFFFGFFLLFR